MKILGVIPARGGSKGVPKKNLRKIGGLSLVERSIRDAQQSQLISRTLLSSDCDEIRAVADRLGNFAPFRRPAELSSDEANIIPTLIHATNYGELLDGCRYDYVVLLQPTSPLRPKGIIDMAINLAIDSMSDSVISVKNSMNTHPIKMKRILNGVLVDFVEGAPENPARQSLEPIYLVNGCIYVVRRDVLIEQRSIKGNVSIPLVMEDKDSINIDSELDLRLAELLWKFGNYEY